MRKFFVKNIQFFKSERRINVRINVARIFKTHVSKIVILFKQFCKTIQF